MRITITFTVPVLPVAQPRQRHRVVASARGAHVQNYTPKDAPVQAFKRAVQLAARAAYKGEPLDGPLYLIIAAIYPGPKAGPRKKPKARQWRFSKPDCDNLAKACLDSCNGILWRDDAQIANLEVQKLYGATGESAKTEIQVTTLD